MVRIIAHALFYTTYQRDSRLPGLPGAAQAGFKSHRTPLQAHPQGKKARLYRNRQGMPSQFVLTKHQCARTLKFPVERIGVSPFARMNTNLHGICFQKYTSFCFLLVIRADIYQPAGPANIRSTVARKKIGKGAQAYHHDGNREFVT